MATKKKSSTSTSKKDDSSSKKEEESKKEEPKSTPKAEKVEAKTEKAEVKEEKKEETFKLISNDGGQEVRVMEVRGHGVMLQVKNEKGNALQWIPKAHVEPDEDTGNYKIVMGF